MGGRADRARRDCHDEALVQRGVRDGPLHRAWTCEAGGREVEAFATPSTLTRPVGNGEPEQTPLFDLPPVWAETWKGMPGYTHVDQMPWKTLLVHFANRADRQAFAELIGQKLTSETKSIWHPEADRVKIAHMHYVAADADATTPQYPVYVISKGRSETRLTSKALERIGVPYRIVIEPQEYDAYAAVIDPEKILVLPFSNLGQGSIPARNWVWEHSIAEGHARHWILDDNIRGFFRFQNNMKARVGDGASFVSIEQFVDRYENIALSGMNYYMFVVRKNGSIPPYYRNTRIYSCILIDNRIPYRWRGRYNEDTDLSIRALKDGWCTMLFNAFLAEKMPTLTMKGGNTKELYGGDGRLLMAQSLVDQHPDIVRVGERWNRFQHVVDYSGFKSNKLVLRPGVVIEDRDEAAEAELRSVAGDEELFVPEREFTGDANATDRPIDELINLEDPALDDLLASFDDEL